MHRARLPAAPTALLQARGIPAFGLYQGIINTLDWRGIECSPKERYTRKLHHKRWQYAGIASETLFISLAVVDTGWAATAFCAVFDRTTGSVRASVSATGLPGWQCRIEDRAFGNASFRQAHRHIRFSRENAHLELSVIAAELRLAAQIDLRDMPPVLSVIAPANWLAHSTHKSGGLSLQGWVEFAGQRHTLEKAIVALDYSNGLLARHTQWHWASAHSATLGFNFQAGYMGAMENVLWLDGQLYRVGPVRFAFDRANLMSPWHIYTHDGSVDLHFTPEGVRQENKNLLIAHSRYIQPIGTFSGWVKSDPIAPPYRIERLLGVTEDHDAYW